MPADGINLVVGEVKARLEQQDDRLLAVADREILIVNLVLLDFLEDAYLVAFLAPGELIEVSLAYVVQSAAMATESAGS